MEPVRFVEPENVEAGDIGFDQGRSHYGAIVRRLTGNREAHCWIYHRALGEGRWLVAEVGAGAGAAMRIRESGPTLVARVWRDDEERNKVLQASRSLVARGITYNWGEIARIVVALVGLRPPPKKVGPRMICSTHVLLCLVAARPDLANAFGDSNDPLWPSKLAARLEALQVEARVDSNTAIA